jgi:signal transduction histidine kinase
VRRIRALFKEAAPVKSLLDVNQVVAEMLGLLAEELRGNGVVVDTDLATDLPMIEADQVQIQQVLINLVHNAIDATSAVTDRATPVVVSTRRGAHEVLIEVRDHGIGVADQALIFEPFFTTKSSGMGMGLAISRSIIEAHGGRLWAAANDDGGMSFSVILPIPAAARA